MPDDFGSLFYSRDLTANYLSFSLRWWCAARIYRRGRAGQCVAVVIVDQQAGGRDLVG